jgi:FkbM family methyltransferase
LLSLLLIVGEWLRDSNSFQSILQSYGKHLVCPESQLKAQVEDKSHEPCKCPCVSPSSCTQLQEIPSVLYIPQKDQIGHSSPTFDVYSLYLQKLLPTQLSKHPVDDTAKQYFDLGNATDLVVDIGLEDWGTFIPLTTQSNSSWAVLNIEALPRNFFNTEHNVKEWARQLKPEIDHSRLPMLNLAVGKNMTQTVFHTAFASACGSILPTANTNNFWCAETVGRIHVPAVTLQWILEHVHPGIRIPIVKIDTEGADLVVVKSAGDLLKRVESVILECQTVHAGAQGQHRQGGCTVNETVSYMESMGFTSSHCPSNEGKLGNCFFGNTKEAVSKAEYLWHHLESEKPKLA